MSDSHGNKLVPVTAMLVLGLGLAALFAGQSWFWMVFAFGFAVVLPIVAILTGHPGENGDAEGNEPVREEEAGLDEDVESKTDALRILRERYARGELSEEQFEAKLDRLMESETLESIRDRREAERERERTPER